MLSDFYQQIQIIMTFLGYYDGDCDGVWGPKCIAAKRVWEFEDSFEPAVPSNGLPFTGRDRLPKGLMYSRKGLKISCLKMTEEDVQKILAEKGCLLTCKHIDEQEEVAAPQKPVAQVAERIAPKVATVAETPLDVPQPKVETVAKEPDPEPEEDDEEEEEEVIPQPQTQNQNQNQKHKGNKDWTQNRRDKQ